MTDDPKQLAHERIADELPLYAIGALAGAQCVNLQRHLEECIGCRRELAQLRGDASLLALSVTGAAAPRRSRQRLLGAIGNEPHLVGAQTEAVAIGRPWWSLAPVFASFVIALFAIFVLLENAEMRRHIRDLEAQALELRDSSVHPRKIVEMLEASDAKHITLVAMKSPPMPEIKTIYRKRTGELLLTANNLPPVAPGKAYELWLMPMQGPPMPAGVFKPDARGSAVYMPPEPMVPPGTEAKAFAVTIEPEGGMPHPTSDVIMMGAGQ